MLGWPAPPKSLQQVLQKRGWCQLEVCMLAQQECLELPEGMVLQVRQWHPMKLNHCQVRQKEVHPNPLLGWLEPQKHLRCCHWCPLRHPAPLQAIGLAVQVRGWPLESGPFGALEVGALGCEGMVTPQR